jgi:hypothetical protein
MPSACETAQGIGRLVVGNLLMVVTGTMPRHRRSLPVTVRSSWNEAVGREHRGSQGGWWALLQRRCGGAVISQSARSPARRAHVACRRRARRAKSGRASAVPVEGRAPRPRVTIDMGAARAAGPSRAV